MRRLIMLSLLLFSLTTPTYAQNILVRWSGDGYGGYGAQIDAGMLVMRDTWDNEIMWTIPADPRTALLSFNAAGATLLAAGMHELTGGEIIIYSVDSGEEIVQFSIAPFIIYAMEFLDQAESEYLLIIAGHPFLGTYLLVWDSTTWQEITEARQPMRGVWFGSISILFVRYCIITLYDDRSWDIWHITNVSTIQLIPIEHDLDDSKVDVCPLP